MAKNKVTAKSRVLEHAKIIKAYAQELIDLCEAYERKAHHQKVDCSDAGDLASIEREFADWGFGEWNNGSPQS